MKAEGLTPEAPFQRFAEGTDEARFLAARGAALRDGMEAQFAMRDRNLAKFKDLTTYLRDRTAKPPS